MYIKGRDRTRVKRRNLGKAIIFLDHNDMENTNIRKQIYRQEKYCTRGQNSDRNIF
jgi:hypothetical protein